MNVETVPVASLHADPANARAHDATNLRAIKASLARFGQQKPIVVGAGNVVTAGNGTLAAALELGWETIQVVRTDLEGAERSAYAIADNRTAELATWHEDVLAATLRGLLDDPTFDPDATGFSDAEIEALLRQSDTGLAAIESGSVPPVPENPITKPGDVWILGDHRIVCGDATDPDVVAKLHGGEVPFLMVTDPPYGVEYDPEWRNDNWSGDRRTGKVSGDERNDWSSVWSAFEGDVAYVWCASWFLPEVGVALSAAGLQRRALIVWAKSRFAISRGHYHWQHEPCWYAVRKGRKSRWCGDRSQSTVWDIEQSTDDTRTNHGTQKPVECLARPMRNHGARGDIVFDPFVGSGTSIIAAEINGRRCHAIDIDPGYVDVSVQRWQDFTKRVATLERDGSPFGGMA